MKTSTFFRLFPPPKFLAMKHAGLDISDDAIHCLEYVPTSYGLSIEKYASTELPAGLIEGGTIRDDAKLIEILKGFVKTNKLSYVKVSLPEEKAYLFQTDVASADPRLARQNIEFKLEENIPLTAADSIFYFDFLPSLMTGDSLRASVSVVPRVYVEQMMNIIKTAGMQPVAFEVVPKSIARAVVPSDSSQTCLIVHMMDHKTGLYIVLNGVVCFSSTIGYGSNVQGPDQETYISNLTKEINRVYLYWGAHGGIQTPIADIILLGRQAAGFENSLHNALTELSVPVPIRAAQIWNNVFDMDHYVPPISQEASLEYAVAAGLALLDSR